MHFGEGSHGRSRRLDSDPCFSRQNAREDEKFSSDCRPLELDLNSEREARRVVASRVFVQRIYSAPSLHGH